jgi:hypothetical protein
MVSSNGRNLIQKVHDAPHPDRLKPRQHGRWPMRSSEKGAKGCVRHGRGRDLLGQGKKVRGGTHLLEMAVGGTVKKWKDGTG